MYKRIVAGTDLSATAQVATDRAAALAARLDARLFLVNAGRGGPELEAQAKAYGAEAVAREGNPAEVLLAECDRLDADLLVVGSVGMSGARRFLLGSVPNKVSHHTTRDLLIVKTDPPPANVAGYRRILVGTDGSPTATRAVEMAAQLAAELGVEMLIVCAFQPPTEHELEQLRASSGDVLSEWRAGGRTAGVPEEFRWRIVGASQAEGVLERAADHAHRFGAEIRVRALEAHPADGLISVAETEGFDLIAVGSVGMSGHKRLMLGNVPNRISHHAPTDVLILRTA